MSQDFLANVQLEGALPDDEKTDEQETETSADSPSDTKVTDESPSQEGGEKDDTSGASKEGSLEESDSNTSDETNNVPFNKHPRFKQVLTERDTYRDLVEQMQGSIQELKAGFEEVKKSTVKSEPDTIPQWFSNVWGEDRHAWNELKSTVNDGGVRSAEDVQRLVQAELQRQRTEQAQTEQKNQQWVEQEFSRIEESFGVSMPQGSDERNEFVSWVMKVRPSNEEGTFDLVRGFEAFQEIKEARRLKASANVDTKKKIASHSVSSQASESKKGAIPPHALRRMTFQELAMEGLKEEGLLE